MALVACPECKTQIAESAPTCPRCGWNQAAHRQAKQQAAQRPAAILLLVLLVGGAVWYYGGIYLEHQKRETEGAPAEPAYCERWLSYYESLCKNYPQNCTEGARKKARCDQGWNKR
jgi:hypothetical protein